MTGVELRSVSPNRESADRHDVEGWRCPMEKCHLGATPDAADRGPTLRPIIARAAEFLRASVFSPEVAIRRGAHSPDWPAAANGMRNSWEMAGDRPRLTSRRTCPPPCGCRR